MKHLIQSYFRFLWNSTNAHGVHSPFVFNLVTKCFYDTLQYSEYKVLENYRNALLQNKEAIEVTDFGAGSRVFKSNTRTVNQIAKNAGISAKRAELLFRLMHYFQPKNVLEIGTSLGLATSALALNNFSS
ncbi:MAG: class I SAM-dependent methyltransferase, partial [Flavobacterium sp.]|nr:class I SAM-dependent methyltransferase [Flavobacterium sp.]